VQRIASLPRAREDGHAPTPRKSDPTPARDGGGVFSPTAPRSEATNDLLRCGRGRRPRERDRAPIGGRESPCCPSRGGASRRGCKTELAAPASGASTGTLTDPRSACWTFQTPASEEAPSEPPTGSGGGSKSRSNRTPAQGGKCDIHRKAGAARGRHLTSDLPSDDSRGTIFGRAEPPIPKGFCGSQEPRRDHHQQTEACDTRRNRVTPTLSRANPESPSSRSRAIENTRAI